MSTSISLGTSADLDTLDSKNNPELLISNKSDNLGVDEYLNQYERIRSCNLKRQSQPSGVFWNNPGKVAHGRLQRGESFMQRGRLARDFYEEVDERMSRNSFEYPDEQAKYVKHWLSDADITASRSPGEDRSNWGKVVGIRGFGGKVEDSRQRTSQNRLKFEFSKLQSDNEILRARLKETVAYFKALARRKDNDIDILKALIDRKLRQSSSQRRHCNECTCAERTAVINCQSRRVCAEEEKLKGDLRQMEMRFCQSEKDNLDRLELLRRENELLRSREEQTRGEYEKELNCLRNEIKALALKPSNRTFIAMQNENERLKDLNEEDVLEFEGLKESYRQLESQYKSLLEEQKRLDERKNEENSNLLLELCRLQVYQPKLELLLKTERDIKLELQNKIKYLEEVADNLREELKGNNVNLLGEKLRSKKLESVESERLFREVSKWQEKYCRLEREKADVEDLLRASRSKVAALDARYQSQVEQWKEKKEADLEEMRTNVLHLEEERNKLAIKVDALARQLEVSTSEQRWSADEVARLTKELQVTIAERQSMGVSLKSVSEAQDRIRSLTDQLRASEKQKNQLVDERELFKSQTERSKQQVEQLRQRIHLQQKAYDELRDQRDKELAKIRGNLKFEQYNRQVALKGIEKELRVSLGELEAMKYRFSQRLAQNDFTEVDASSQQQPTVAINGSRNEHSSNSNIKVSR